MTKPAILVLLAISVFPNISSAATPAKVPSLLPSTPEGSVCTELMEEYEDTSKVISEILIEGVDDDSAPRETMRQSKITNEIARANVLVGIMQARKCPIPIHGPGDNYPSAATECAAKRMEYLRAKAIVDSTHADFDKQVAARGPMEVSCNTKNWQPG